MKNLCEPFVTTKTSGHSGFGLSIVQKTINDLGGSISCTSKPNAGTRFSIRLPLVKRSPIANEV
jgi:signal transduction histidine kinase